MFKKEIILDSKIDFTKKEKLILNLAIDLGYDLINMSISEIAKKTKTSPATVNRTFSKLGYTGLKFYKMFLFSEKKQNLKENNILNLNENEELFFQKKFLLNSLENLFIEINYEKIKKVAKLIDLNKEGILMVGDGFSKHVMHIFAKKLVKIFYNVKFYSESTHSEILRTNLLIAFSSKGDSKKFLNKVNTIKKFKPQLKVIVITNNILLEESEKIDYVLGVQHLKNYRMDDHELPSDSIVMLISLCNIIFYRIYFLNEKKNKTFVEKTKKIRSDEINDLNN